MRTVYILFISFCFLMNILGIYAFFSKKKVVKSSYAIKSYDENSPKKIAFCFLIYDKINHEELWYNWFKNVDKNKYDIYIHYKENKPLKYFDKYKLSNNISTKYADVSLIHAHNLLFKEAFNDNNYKVISLSGSCIPVKSFDHVYNYLTRDNYGHFNVASKKYLFPRCNILLKRYDKEHINKSSEWFILNRNIIEHINKISKNEIDEMYSDIYAPEEHFYITLVYANNLQDSIKIDNNLSYSTTFTGWPDMTDYKKFSTSILKKNEPNEYIKIGDDELQYLVNSSSLFARKFTSECNLDKLYSLLRLEPTKDNYNIEKDVLPYAFYINLKHRKDRYDNVQKQMKWWPKNKLIRIDAIKHEDGVLGCGLSHIKALKHAKKIANSHNQSYVLILEDDFKWKFDEIKTKNILNNTMQFNIDWNVITLITCSSCGVKIENTDNILRKVTNSGSAAGYIVKTNYIDKIIDNFENIISIRVKNNINKNNPQYDREHNDRSTQIDQEWKKLQLTDDWYITNPTLIRIINGPSNIYENNIQDPVIGSYD